MLRVNNQQSVVQLLAVLVVVIVIAVGEYVGFFVLPKSFSELVVSPFLRLGVSTISLFESPFVTLGNSYHAARRIQDLELRLSQAQAELSQMEGLKRENESLRQIVENTDRDYHQVYLSMPIVSFASPTIKGGQDVGLELGDVVLVGRTLVGLIERVSPRFSQVSLIGHNNSRPVVAVTESGHEGIIISQGKKIILSELPVDVEVEVGEKVVTAGQPDIPADLLVGQVSDIVQDETSPVKRVVIDQLVNFYQARVVEVYLD